jgi:hypothetical protein
MRPTIITLLQRLDEGVSLALLLPFFALLPLLTHAGLPNSADGPAHLMRQVELNQAWQEGNFYPRWGTDLALGHGMPIFSYAPPLLYQLAQILHLCSLPLDEAMKGVILCDFLLYSVGMFLFARRLYGPGPALVAAALYVYAPYRLREAYIQGNYGQFTGLALYPFILWAFHGLATDGRQRYLAATGVSLAGLLLSHNISAMLFAPLLAAYLLFLLAQQREEAVSCLGRLVAGGLLGLGLAAIFWLPAFGERHAIKLEGITQGFFDFRENFVTLPELLAPPLLLDLAAINPYFPLSLGLPQISAVLIACVALAKGRGSERVSHTLFFVLALLLYVFLALPYARPFWEAVPLLELAEFPWRMLGPAILCAAFLAAAGLSCLCSPFTIYHSSFIIFCVIALNAPYLYPSQFIVWGTPQPADAFAYEVASGAIGTTSTGEFLPRGAQIHPRPDTLWPDYAAGRPPQKLDPASLPPGASVETVSHQAEADTLRLSTPQGFTATLRTLYWPGWQVYLNGQPIPFTVTSRTGLIQAAIPPGQHTLTLQLELTPLRRLGTWSSLLSLLILLLIVGRGGRASCLSTVTHQPLVVSPKQWLVVVGSGVFLLVAYLLARPLFTLQSDPDTPPAERVLQVDFGEEMRLVGADGPAGQVVRLGMELPFTLYWRARHDLDTNYSIFVHLDAPDGETVAGVDEEHPAHVPTRNWPPGLYLRQPLRLEIPPDLPPIRYTLNVGVYDRERGIRLPLALGQTTFTLAPIWLDGPPSAITGPAVAHFGPQITLLQATYQEGNLLLYWRTTQPLEQDHTIFVHLLDAGGKLIGQADGPPYEGGYPLRDWRPGQIIADRRPIAATGLESIAVGIYDPDSGDRLPAVTPQGDPLPGDSYLLPAR